MIPDPIREYLIRNFSAEPVPNCMNAPTLQVPMEQLKAALIYLKHESNPRFEMLFDLSAIDESDRNQNGYSVFYHLMSLSGNRDFRLVVNCPDEACLVPSITDIWPSANWYEREVYDMFGLKFSDHPNLKRLLMPEYWEGHPLRKSYPFRATDMPEPFDLDTNDYARIMESYAIKDVVDNPHDDTMTLNIGPNHPGTHGIIRLMVQLRGETLVHIDQEIGFHHRGAEKLAERHTYHNYIPYTDRIDYLGGVAGELPYLLAIEHMTQTEVPERATVMRVMLSELFRLSSHLVWLGSFGHDVGAMGPAFYCFKVREKIFDATEMITGARMHPAFFRIGGVALDLPEGWERAVLAACDAVEESLPELQSLTIDSKIFQARSRDVGVVSQADAIDWGFTGPNLRATGINMDLRKTRPYCQYEDYDFDVPTADYGDCFNRVKIRILELYETVKIIRQAVKKMPSGSILADNNSRYGFPKKVDSLQNIESLIHHFVETGRGLFLPIGESFFATETSKGITGYHLVSHGRPCPYRLRIRTPSFPHFQSVKAVCEGDQIGNMIPYISSIDYVLADLDR